MGVTDLSGVMPVEDKGGGSRNEPGKPSLFNADRHMWKNTGEEAKLGREASEHNSDLTAS